MHLHFERIEKPHSYSDCNILSLSWMGKVPDGLLQSQDEEGWKLNRTNYYQDGWIALGNSRGIVGVTYTTCRCRKTSQTELPSRTNYNLRGHRSEVTLVKWNEPYQKLASCDSSGTIFVWIKYEGRWSVELINDRNTQVTDFSWSHDGRMALICYIDGFVLIGSVAGQRYWSSMLNLDSCSTTCGIWTPDDQQVIFGTSNGSILVIDINGTIVAQLSIREGHAISSMSWSSEKFKMEDIEEESTTSPTGNNGGSILGGRNYVLAICFDDGILYLLKNYDDIFPIIIRTNLKAIKMEWSNKGEILAVGGHQMGHHRDSNAATSNQPSYINVIQFYSESGSLRYKVTLDHTNHPIASLTWGHNDKRLFVGTGPVLHIAWVTKRIASLQLFCRLVIHRTLSLEQDVESLPLPSMLQNLVASLFGRTLRCYLPDNQNLTKFVVNPPSGNVRLYCTLIRHDDDLIGGSSSYVLYLEYLGGLVPILKGKRTSKFRPEFVIFDPQAKNCDEIVSTSCGGYISSNNSTSSGSKRAGSGHQTPQLYWHTSSTPGTSDSESEDHIATKMRKKRRQHRARRNHHEAHGAGGDNEINGINRPPPNGHLKPESTHMDGMPEDEKLTLVTSNIWGTKFKIIGLAPWLPSHLGSVAYRTSLLHLQPRQMTLKIKELGGQRERTAFEDISSSASDKLLVTSSEDEDDGSSGPYDDDYGIPVAPMTPKKTFRCHQSQSSIISPQRQATSLFLRSTNFSNHNDSFGSDYVNLISHLNEDLLTLQVNGDSNGQQLVTMEMTSAPSYSSNFPTSQPAQPPPSASNSISTQTSFQSLTDILNPMITEKHLQSHVTSSRPPASSSFVSNGINLEDKTETNYETRTEETFTMMAKRFSDTPCTSKTPASQSLAFNRYEIFQPVSCNLQQMLTSVSTLDGYNSVTSNSNTSPPPKSARYKRTAKRDSCRKALVRTDSGSSGGDSIPTKSMISTCDTNNCYKCARETKFTLTLGPSSPTNWSPSFSLFQYSSNGGSGANCLAGGINGAGQISGISGIGASFSGGCLSGIDSCLVESKHIHSSSTSHDIKYIDDIEVDDLIVGQEASSSTAAASSSSSSVGYSFGRSPSLLFYRNRSSIAQFHSTPPYLASHHPSDFTNIRVTGEGSTIGCCHSQRRYTLASNCKNEQSAEETEDGQSRTCMSLDEDLETKPGIPTSATFCKCTEETEEMKDGKACISRSSSNNGLVDCLYGGGSGGGGLKETGDHNQTPIISTPSHVTKKKFLHFDSEEVLNSLNDCNSLLNETYSPLGGKSDETRTSGGGNLTGPRSGHRGSLPQSVIPESGSLSKNIRSELINRSLPASPMLGQRNRRKAQGKSLFYSPTMFRKVMKQKLNYLDCSSDDDNSSDDEQYRASQDFRNLGSFQRSNMKKKIKVKRRSSRVQPDENVNQRHSDGREFVLHNKAPLWNEVSQVYQLDFGGRVTQESAKNFQIEHQGKQVMQFGRIDDNAYTLDFQYPFSALQALAVALANVTQRLK